LERLRAEMLAQMAELEAANAAFNASAGDLDKARADAEARARAAEEARKKAILANILARMQNRGSFSAIKIWKDKVQAHNEALARLKGAAGKCTSMLNRLAEQARLRLLQQMSRLIHTWEKNCSKAKLDAAMAAAAAAAAALAKAQSEMAAMKDMLDQYGPGGAAAAAAAAAMAAVQAELEGARNALAAMAAEKAAMAAALAAKDKLIGDLMAKAAQMQAAMAAMQAAFANALNLLRGLFAEVDNAAARTSELINADPVALGLPAVYAQHKLNPLCEYKVEKVVENYQVIFAKMQVSFKMAIPRMEEIEAAM